MATSTKIFNVFLLLLVISVLSMLVYLSRTDFESKAVNIATLFKSTDRLPNTAKRVNNDSSKINGKNLTSVDQVLPDSKPNRVNASINLDEVDGVDVMVKVTDDETDEANKNADVKTDAVDKINENHLVEDKTKDENKDVDAVDDSNVNDGLLNDIADVEDANVDKTIQNKTSADNADVKNVEQSVENKVKNPEDGLNSDTDVKNMDQNVLEKNQSSNIKDENVETNDINMNLSPGNKTQYDEIDGNRDDNSGIAVINDKQNPEDSNSNGAADIDINITDNDLANRPNNSRLGDSVKADVSQTAENKTLDDTVNNVEHSSVVQQLSDNSGVNGTNNEFPDFSGNAKVDDGNKIPANEDGNRNTGQNHEDSNSNDIDGIDLNKTDDNLATNIHLDGSVKADVSQTAENKTIDVNVEVDDIDGNRADPRPADKSDVKDTIDDFLNSASNSTVVNGNKNPDDKNDIDGNHDAKKLDANEEIPFVHPNYKWLFNNNIMQHSVFIIKNSTDTWIESLVNIWFKDLPYNYQIKNEEFVAAVKIHDTNEIIEMKAFQVFETSPIEIKRVFFRYDSKKIKNSKISVGIILIGDYTKDLENVRLNVARKLFPFSTINFQEPDVIEVQEPRLPGVGHCIKHIYYFKGDVASFLHLSKHFGLSEIWLYDITPKREVEKLVRSDPDKYNFVKLIDYNLDENEICANSSKSIDSLDIPDRDKLKRVHKETCLHYVMKELYPSNLFRHEDFTENECYIKIGYTYEFVALYDTDEIVFPRNHETDMFYETKSIKALNCKDKEVCQFEPFSYGLYDYVKNIILDNGDIKPDKVSGIYFHHTAYFPPEREMETVIQLRNTLNAIEAQAPQYTTFPILLPVMGHIYIINQTDIEYIKYLLQLYDSLSCMFPYLASIKNYEKNFIRYMFHTTTRQERFPKYIHNTKNVQILWCHYAWRVTPGSRKMFSNYIKGEFLAHFRGHLDMYWHNATSSIRNLNIDVEYLSYMLKTQTNFCEK